MKDLERIPAYKDMIENEKKEKVKVKEKINNK